MQIEQMRIDLGLWEAAIMVLLGAFGFCLIAWRRRIPVSGNAGKGRPSEYTDGDAGRRRMSGASLLWLSGAATVGGGLAFALAAFVRTPGAVLTGLAFCCVLFAVALHDIAVMEIEDWCHAVLLLLGVVAVFTLPGLSGIAGRFLGLVVISVPMLLLALLIPGAFGGGDIKLMGAAGFFLGARLISVAMLLGIGLGGIYGIVLLLAKKGGRGTQFAFGPFLCVGMVLAFLLGDWLIAWYAGWLH